MTIVVHPLRDTRATAAAGVTQLAAVLVALAAGLAANSLLGPFGAAAVEFNVSETHRNQMLGLDAVSLLVVAPLALVAALLVVRRHAAGALLAVGIGGYTAYMFVQFVVGPDYLHRPGDSAKLFPLYLALFVAGWLAALLGWRALGATEIEGTRRRDRAVGAIVLPLLGLATFVRYLPALADVMSEQPTMGDYLAGPAFFWSIALMDLGIFLPATAAACFGLLRGTAWGRRLAYALAGWFAFVGVAVSAMAIAMYVNDDPNAAGTNVVFMTVLGLVFAALAVTLYRPLLARTR